MTLPVIDIGPLRDGSDPAGVANAIGAACRDIGFFYITGHGIDPGLLERIESQGKAFFDRPRAEKLKIDMRHGGQAWRGFFPVGGELTSGAPDLKEGLYFGSELPADDPRVVARTPLHGPNQFPAKPEGFKETVLEFLDVMTALGHTLTEAISLSLGLERSYLADRYTADPLVLFRIFHYPPPPPGGGGWGVGEHTDYGLLTLLHQDARGGLEVKTDSGWIPAPPIPGTFVCNLGDMLDRLTGGLYRSTPHRVRNESGHSRYSFPFFFDPNMGARLEPIVAATDDDAERRWDGESVHAFEGTYGDYLLNKVGRVFPQLRDQVF